LNCFHGFQIRLHWGFGCSLYHHQLSKHTPTTIRNWRYQTDFVNGKSDKTEWVDSYQSNLLPPLGIPSAKKRSLGPFSQLTSGWTISE